jgi:hypothetical protein
MRSHHSKTFDWSCPFSDSNCFRLRHRITGTLSAVYVSDAIPDRCIASGLNRSEPQVALHRLGENALIHSKHCTAAPV